MILLVDNYDSFTYNIAQYLGELGAEVSVKRNDAISVEDVRSSGFEGIVISPGPGRPEGAGISVALVKEFAGEMPILGICLGHQCIAVSYGARVTQGHRIVHGKTSEIHHDGDELFEGVASTFEATRYHSLLVSADSVKPPLRIIARTSEGEVMALRHAELPLWGVQFHPESILTRCGMRILKNFLEKGTGPGRR